MGSGHGVDKPDKAHHTRRQVSRDALYENISSSPTGEVTGLSQNYPSNADLPPGMDVSIGRDYIRGGSQADPTSIRVEGVHELPEENKWGHTHLVGLGYRSIQDRRDNRPSAAKALYGVNPKTGKKSLYAD